jgi:hypothetical protein
LVELGRRAGKARYVNHSWTFVSYSSTQFCIELLVNM